MSSHLELLIHNRQRNVEKIKEINRQGKYGFMLEGWYIANNELDGIIPAKILEEAMMLFKENKKLILEYQIKAFNSFEQVKRFNKEYGGKIFVQYDPKMGFVDNCRRGFKPFPDRPDGPTLYLFSDAEDEIIKEVIKQFEPTYLVSTLTRLNKLYDKAIGFLKESESPE